MTSIYTESGFQQIVEQYTDVINERLGGKVTKFSDEFFAKAENLIKPHAPIRDPLKFVDSGKWYDGWETRRHNQEPADWVEIHAGVASARVIGCEVDTAFFSGNHAPEISVEGLRDGKWDVLIDKVECGPNQKHYFVRKAGLTTESYSTFRLNMYPDGGIARFRLYGRAVPVLPKDGGLLDTAAVQNGGVTVGASDQHFSPADNILLPGRGHDMLDGWETARSRAPGHVDWVVIKLGAPTVISNIVVDTANFKGNFPQKVNLKGFNGEPPKFDSKEWVTLVPDSKTGPHKEHKYDVLDKNVYTHVLLTLIPDGGVKRVRVFGTIKNE